VREVHLFQQISITARPLLTARATNGPNSAADLALVEEIRHLLLRSLISKQRIASALITFAFEICADDARAQIFLLQQILKRNADLKPVED
jgi:hypothetical protein